MRFARRLYMLMLVCLTGIGIALGHGVVAHGVAPASVRVGWYLGSPAVSDRLRAYRQNGADLVVLQYHGTAATDKGLRYAAAQHVSVLLEPDFRWVVDGQLGSLKRFVDRYRNDSAVYGWYLFDEPDFVGLPPARLTSAYRVLKAVDRRHPVAVNFVTGQCEFRPGAISPEYLSGFDLLMFDRYPFYADMPHFDPLRDAQRVDANCYHSAHRFHKQGPILVLQGFGKGIKDGPFRFRDPTTNELECEFGSAVRSRPAAVLFYNDQLADPQVRLSVDRIMKWWSGTGRRLESVPSLCPARRNRVRR